MDQGSDQVGPETFDAAQGRVDILRGLNCDQFQGYLFGTAMPPVDLPAFILRQNTVTSLVPEPPARFAS